MKVWVMKVWGNWIGAHLSGTGPVLALRAWLAASTRLLLVAGLTCAPVLAQTYPAKPIRLLVGFTPGGPVDTIARLVAQGLSDGMGVAVNVENRPGADTIIATELVAKAVPDGYTLLTMSPSATIHPSLYARLPYTVATDFVPITLVATTSYVVVVHPSVTVGSVKDFVAMAISSPGQLNYGGAGIGDAMHLAVELFKTMGGIDIQLIDYKGGAPAMTALVGGHVQFMISPMGIAMPHIKSGRVKALATTGARRSPTLPDLPTVSESGVPGYEASGWYGVLAPVGTPRPIVDRLNAEIVKALKQPEVQQKLAALGMEAVGNSPDQMAQFMASERVKWAKAVKSANIAPR